MKILMGTKNPGKIEGARQAFENYFDNIEIEGIGVSSDVSNQPINEEIFLGAKNRVKNLKLYAKENNLEADFYIASEAGIINFDGDLYGKNIEIEITSKIRDEKKFNGLEELRTQIEKDVKECLKL